MLVLNVEKPTDKNGNESKIHWMSKKFKFKQFFGHPPTIFVQDPAANSLIEERNHPQPKRVINELVKRCGTNQVLRKSSANYTWDVSPGASGPYEIVGTFFKLTFSLIGLPQTKFLFTGTAPVNNLFLLVNYLYVDQFLSI
jgi:hypothetical protein